MNTEPRNYVGTNAKIISVPESPDNIRVKLKAQGDTFRLKSDPQFVEQYEKHIGVGRLRLYKDAGQPYGESEEGLNRWEEEILEELNAKCD